MLRITESEWARTHRDFKGTVLGQKVLLRLDHETETTELVPVDIVPDVPTSDKNGA